MASFRIVQWNILAEGLDAPSDFPQSPPECLVPPSARFDRVREVIRKDLSTPEIVCLQELNHPEQMALSFSRHAMLYLAKLDSPCLNTGCPPDGCCMLINRDRFDILDSVMQHYRLAGREHDEDSPLSNQCFILAKLKDKKNGKILLVGTTHLKAKAGEAEQAARLSQTRQLLGIVSAKATHLGSPIPVILLGDFNSDHGKEGVVYETLRASSLSLSSCYNANTQRSQIGKVIHFDNDDDTAVAAAESELERLQIPPTLSTPPTPPNSPSPRPVASDYKLGEPKYTTWKFRGSKAASEKKECIDYMWATLEPLSGGESDVVGPRLALRNVIPLRGPSSTGPRGLPSATFPSDHLFLCCDFELL